MENTSKVEKNLDYYMSLPYEEHVIPDPAGGYVATVPDLPGCITQGETIEEVLYMIEDAKKCWLEGALDLGQKIIEPTNLGEYGGRFSIRLPRSLHKKLAETAESEGVNINQLVTYLLADKLGEKILEEN